MGLSISKETSLSALIEWRKEVIRNVFGEDADDELIAHNIEYLKAHIADGSHIAFVASTDGCECGCGAVCLYDEMPSPDNHSGHCAYIMNIYVRPKYRNQGVAHQIVRHLIEEAHKHQCDKIYLETTAKARELYRSLGFDDMPDMMKYK